MRAAPFVMLLGLLWALPVGASSPPGFPEKTTPPVALDVPAETPVWTHPVITGETSWSGNLLVRAPVEIAADATLTLLPGAMIFFDMPPAGNAPPPPWISVRGRLLSLGTAASPVTLASVRAIDDPRSDMISAVEARELRLRHTRLTRGGWGLHLHDTPETEIEGCEFTDLYGGLRFKSYGLTVRGSLFARNRIGIRLLESSGVRIEGNAFRGNLTGIFFRQRIRNALVTGNEFDDVEYDVKLGEDQGDDVAAPGNFWKTPGLLYDAGDAEGLGTVRIEPPLAAPPPRNLP